MEIPYLNMAALKRRILKFILIFSYLNIDLTLENNANPNFSMQVYVFTFLFDYPHSGVTHIHTTTNTTIEQIDFISALTLVR